MKIISILILTVAFAGCSKFPMPGNPSGKEVQVDLKLGQINFDDSAITFEASDDMKSYSLDQKAKTEIEEIIKNSATGKGDKFNLTIVIKDAKAEVVKDEIANKKIEIISTIAIEYLTEEGKSNYVTETTTKNIIEYPTYDWEDIDEAYLRTLKSTVQAGLIEFREKLK